MGSTYAVTKQMDSSAGCDLTDADFEQIRNWLYKYTNIYLNESKKSLVSGRLNKRLRDLDLFDYASYVRLLKSGDAKEEQVAINLLTTNETYFFREPKHFDYMISDVLPSFKRNAGEFKLWSAAASSGEESYTLAMVLADALGAQGNWRITGTDINTQVLGSARRGIYSMPAAEKIPYELLKRYCVRGKGKDAGLFRFRPEMRDKILFFKHNLMQPLDIPDRFDVVFLRNVLIYFDLQDKNRVVQNILRSIKPGGWLLVGHSESITGYDPRLIQQRAGCYRYQP